MQFHAVMIDETGCEFGVSFTTSSRADAYDYLAENYPESSVADLSDSEQIRDRERRQQERIERMLDGDWPDDYDY